MHQCVVQCLQNLQIKPTATKCASDKTNTTPARRRTSGAAQYQYHRPCSAAAGHLAHTHSTGAWQFAAGRNVCGASTRAPRAWHPPSGRNGRGRRALAFLHYVTPDRPHHVQRRAPTSQVDGTAAADPCVQNACPTLRVDCNWHGQICLGQGEEPTEHYKPTRP